MSRVNTPGVGGYLAAWLVSVGTFAVLLALGSRTFDPLVAGVLLVAVLVVSTPFAVVGMLAVHFLCRHVGAQWVHVVAAGVAGFVAFCWVNLLLGVLVGGATAFGRASVVPMVDERRRDSEQSAARC